MGFIWQGKKLVCDFCGTAGATKQRCSFDYCPPVAACPACKKTKKDKLNKAYHKSQGCDIKHNEFMAQVNKEKELFDAGEWIRTSAYGPKDIVEVTFKNNKGEIKVVNMPSEIYKTIPYGVPATLKDYEKINGKEF